MQPNKLAASLSAAMVTVSLLAGVRAGFEATPVTTPAPSALVRLRPATAHDPARPARGANRTGDAITMPYYSYGASLPTLLKD